MCSTLFMCNISKNNGDRLICIGNQAIASIAAFPQMICDKIIYFQCNPLFSASVSVCWEVFFLFNFVVVFGSPLFFWFGLYCLPFATATTSSLVLEIWNPLQSQKWIKVREREKEWEGENERKSEMGGRTSESSNGQYTCATLSICHFQRHNLSSR